jgi:hypothetical protein
VNIRNQKKRNVNSSSTFGSAKTFPYPFPQGGGMSVRTGLGDCIFVVEEDGRRGIKLYLKPTKG